MLVVTLGPLVESKKEMPPTLWSGTQNHVFMKEPSSSKLKEKNLKYFYPLKLVRLDIRNPRMMFDTQAGRAVKI